MKLTAVIWSVVLAVAMLTDCSMVDVHRVRPPAPKEHWWQSSDINADGVRYFMSAPYLLVKKPIELTRREGIYRVVNGEFVRMGGAVSFVEANADADSPKKADEDKPAAKDEKKDAAPGGDMELVWMPDYCQEYRATQFNFLATNKLSMKFTSGSQLDSINSELDSTAVAGKFLDFLGSVAGTVAGAVKPAAPAPDNTELVVKKKKRAAPSEQLWKCAEITTLPPNLYPLIEYGGTFPDSVSGYDCQTQLPHVTFAAVKAAIADANAGKHALVCDPKPLGGA